MSARVLSKRKSENDVTDNFEPQTKRALTERIARGIGGIRLNDLQPQTNAQGNSRLQRTLSTPSNMQYTQPLFTPSRPDLVSSFELNPPPQSMDEDQDMPMSYEPTTMSTSAPSSAFTFQQNCILAPQSASYNPIYSQQPMFNNGTTQGAPIPMLVGREGIVSQASVDKSEELPKYTLLIPKFYHKPLEIPIEPPSQALILYTPMREVIEDSISKNQKALDKTKANATPPAPVDFAEQMMLD